MSKRVLTGFLVMVGMLVVLLPSVFLAWWALPFLIILALILCLELHHALSRLYKPLSLGLTLASGLVMLVPLPIWFFARKLHPGWQFLFADQLRSPDLAAWQQDFVYLLSLSASAILACAFGFALCCLLRAALRRGADTLTQTLAALLAGFYVGLPLSAATLYLFAVPNGVKWLLFAVFTPWIADVGAYYTGRYFGRRPFFNHVSPKKTLEGALGGVASAALLGGVYFLAWFSGDGVTQRRSAVALLFGLAGAALLALAGEMGDLFASALKRRCGVKDFGRALPGHGGFLDRFDSVLFSLPLSLLLALVYYLTPGLG